MNGAKTGNSQESESRSGEAAVPGKDNAPAPAANDTAQPDSGDLEALRLRAQERDEFLDLLQRTRAEFENYQKRNRQEREQERRYQYGPFALDLLPVLDNLERALAAALQAGDEGPLAQGVAMVQTQLLDLLKRYSITPIDAQGKVFDPHFHQAVMQKENTGQEPHHAVVQVLSQGFMIRDRVLRPAKVVVAK